MLKKLKIKFVCINMTIVTVMLVIILSLLLYFTREQLASETVRMMQSVLADPFQTETASFHKMLSICIAVGLGSLILFFFASLFLAGWSIRPVSSAWKEQRQFISDASHELKTPLAVIMTSAELIRDTPCSDETHIQSADNILTVSRQMRSLVESMLKLARTENGIPKEAVTRVNLSSVLSEELLLFEPLFFEGNCSVTGQIEEEIFVEGSEAYLKQAAEVLLDNARKYSFPETETRVALKRQGHSSCILSVASHGEAISPENLKNIFKRFYRVEKARTRTGSYGLGLSITEKIVQLHHGRIWAESENGVNTFFIQLPVSHKNKE